MFKIHAANTVKNILAFECDMSGNHFMTEFMSIFSRSFVEFPVRLTTLFHVVWFGGRYLNFKSSFVLHSARWLHIPIKDEQVSEFLRKVAICIKAICGMPMCMITTHHPSVTT
jgi:hypothetical protein